MRCLTAVGARLLAEALEALNVALSHAELGDRFDAQRIFHLNVDR
jgi:hypothetical protein